MHAFAVPTPTEYDIVDIELPDPQPTAGEVLLRVERSGVCHTDIHLRAGYYDLGSQGQMRLVDRGISYPLVMGHEVVGVVTAAGPGVTDVKVGDRRLVYPWIGDGTCEACLSGNDNLCAAGRNLGVARHGGYADMILVPDERYLLNIDGIEEGWAATLACSGLTAYSAALKAKPADPELPVVVIGAGGVGLMAIALLRRLGHESVIAVDLQERNLELARALGATATVSAATEPLAPAIISAAGGPVISVVDFVNSSLTAPVAFAALRKGGRMIQVGLFGGELLIPTPLLPLKAVTVQGSFVGSLPELRDLVEIAKSGDLPAIPIIDAELSAAGVQESLDRITTGGVPGRIVLRA